MTAPTTARKLDLDGGRALAVAEDGAAFELRSPSGTLELRVRITADGPVVEVDAARLELRARAAIDITSRRVAIRATDAIEVASGGDVRVVGATIYLN